MERQDDALVLTLLPHGDHGAVVRFLGLSGGPVAAFVHGARSRRRRADLAPGNKVRLSLSARLPDQLPTAMIEPVASRALLAFDARTAAALDYLVQLLAGVLPEGEACPTVAASLDALLDQMVADSDWPVAMARFERDLLAELGFGLDLSACARTGRTDDLAFVSPRSGRAVTRAAAAGQPWAGRLLPLPAFLAAGAPTPGRVSPADRDAGLALTGHFLARHIFPDMPRAAGLRAEALVRLGLAAS